MSDNKQQETQPNVLRYKGTLLSELTDAELDEATEVSRNLFIDGSGQLSHSLAVAQEKDRRRAMREAISRGINYKLPYAKGGKTNAAEEGVMCFFCSDTGEDENGNLCQGC